MRKKFFILLSALVAMASGVQAATDYGFKMLNVSITSDNYQSEASGKPWYYDPTNNVLHLTDGTIGVYNVYSMTILEINGDVNPTLTIQVDGACEFGRIFTEGIHFKGNGKHTICGDGTLTMESSKTNPQVIVGVGKPSLTVKDVTMNIKAWGESAVGFNNHEFEEIVLDNCEINIITSAYAWSSITFRSAKPVLKNCIFTNGYFGTNGTAYGPDGKQLEELHIKRMPVSTVDLTVVEPVAGNVVSTKYTAKSDKYYATIVEWYKVLDGGQFKMKEGDAFKDGETYKVVAILKTTKGYRFADKDDIAIYVNGEEGEIYYYQSEEVIRLNAPLT